MTTESPPPPVPPIATPGRLETLHDGLTSPGGRLIRYLLVLAIVGTAVYLSLIDWFQVCKVVDSAKDGLTETCSGPDLTSAGVLATVIFVLLLLWPDLSEFSAFGVTVKKLVQEVKEKVTETRDKAAHIDSTTTETRSRLENLQTAVADQGGDISERLSLIQSGLTRLVPSETTGDSSPFANPAPLRPAPRWDSFDEGNFVNACESLFEPGELAQAIAELRNTIGEPSWDTPAGLDVDRRVAVYVGVIIELFRQFRTQWDADRWTEWARRTEIDAILRSIEWMLLAIIGGKRVNEDSLRAAAGVLVLLRRNGS